MHVHDMPPKYTTIHSIADCSNTYGTWSLHYLYTRVRSSPKVVGGCCARVLVTGSPSRFVMSVVRVRNYPHLVMPSTCKSATGSYHYQIKVCLLNIIHSCAKKSIIVCVIFRYLESQFHKQDYSP